MKKRSLQENSKHSWLAAVAYIAVVATPLLLLSGCGNDSTGSLNEPVVESFFDQTYNDPGFQIDTDAAAVLFKHRRGESTEQTLNVYYGEDVISANKSGVVKLDMPGTGEFWVARGSIPSDTKISVAAQFTKVKGRMIGLVRFGPSGLVFSESAELRFELEVFGIKSRAVKHNFVTFYWLNPETSRWELQGKYSADKKGIVHVPVDHFSMYGVE